MVGIGRTLGRTKRQKSIFLNRLKWALIAGVALFLMIWQIPMRQTERTVEIEVPKAREIR